MRYIAGEPITGKEYVHRAHQLAIETMLFVIDNDIRCVEDIYQQDKVARNALPFIEKLVEAMGYLPPQE